MNDKLSKSAVSQPQPPAITEALVLAAGIIRRPEMNQHFLYTSLRQGKDSSAPIKECASIPDALWVQGMGEAFKNKKFVSLVDEMISKSRKTFNAKQIAIKYADGGAMPDSDPVMMAIRRTAYCLESDHNNPRWTALVLFSIARMAGTTALSQYKEPVWSAFTLQIMSVERSLLLGDGKSFAKDVLKLVTLITHPLPALIGERITHGFIEAALINGGKPRFFEEKIVLH